MSAPKFEQYCWACGHRMPPKPKNRKRPSAFKVSLTFKMLKIAYQPCDWITRLNNWWEGLFDA